MTFTQVIKGIKKAETLLVTPKVITFLLDHPEGVVWDEEAYAVWKELTSTHAKNEDRSGRFGASARGDCPRRQVFGFLGMPMTRVLAPETQNLFEDGRWRHLRWQMMALQAGAITHAEYPYAYPALRLSGRMDGLNSFESFGFELKGDRNWSRTLAGVPEEHMAQMHAMMLATGWDTFSYVIEDKSSQQWREIVVHRDKRIIAVVRAELEELNDYVERHTLPPVLPACAAKEGPYRSCPFAHRCLERARIGDAFPDRPGDWES